MKPILLILFSFVSFLTGFSQGNIKGKIIDSAGKEPLGFATIAVFKASDTSLITYRLSTPDGNFKVPGLPLNIECRLVITFSGYKVFRKLFILTSSQSQSDIGNIYLSPDSTSLDEVLVIAERPPVIFRRDTIEFNASAFKTLPSALVEDLLKKFPGVEIDPEGNITVNGRKVNRLLVDGKEFFGGDPRIATRNLPANIVDKVQVTDDKEELQNNPDIPKADLGQIVNIKLKKAIKQGWFGKAYAGVGTNDRYETGAILNVFRDTTQLSLLAYSNNINKAGFGFNDIQKIGGFDRSSSNSFSVNSEGGFSINDISFGATGQGLQRSSGGGMNFNQQFGRKVTLNLQYFYGEIQSEYDQLGNMQRFLNDTILFSQNKSNSKSVSINHRTGGSIIWKIDSFTTLTYRPSVSIDKSRSASVSFSNTESNFKGPVNKTDNYSTSEGNGTGYNHSFQLQKNFRKKGRIFNLNSTVSFNRNENDNLRDGTYTFYYTGQGTDSLINQLRSGENENSRASINLSFNEPITKKTGIRLSQSSEYLKQENIADFFLKDYNSGKYDIFHQDFSNGSDRSGWRNTSTIALSFRINKLSIIPAINYFILDINNHFVKNPSIRQRYDYVFPSFNANIGSLNFGYRPNINEPRATDLQEVIDISNPLYKSYGNPNLKPSYTHNISINFYKDNRKNGSSLSIYSNYNLTNNATIRETTIDDVGAQTSRPINVNNLKSGYVSLFYNYQYKFNKNLRLSIRPGAYGNFSEGKISINGNSSDLTNIYANGSLHLLLNYKDILELNNRISINYNTSLYSNKTAYKDRKVVRKSSESEVVIRWPKHFVWESVVNYSYNPQVGQGIRKSTVRWNAGLNFLFLKEDKAQFKLSVFDLLKQNVNVYRFTSDNYISDFQTTTLTRYVMLSFIYNIRTFSGGKVGGKDRSFFFF